VRIFSKIVLSIIIVVAIIVVKLLSSISIIVVEILSGWPSSFLESLLNLLVTVLILLRLHCERHQFWVDLVTWLSEFMILMSKVTFVCECANLVRFVMSAPLSFVFVIDFINICLSIVLVVTIVSHLVLHLIVVHHWLHMIHIVHLILVLHPHYVIHIVHRHALRVHNILHLLLIHHL
jgi:hypothetical protein